MAISGSALRSNTGSRFGLFFNEHWPGNLGCLLRAITWHERRWLAGALHACLGAEEEESKKALFKHMNGKVAGTIHMCTSRPCYQNTPDEHI